MKRTRKLAADLEAAGFTTRVTSKQHLLVMLNGQTVTCFAGTPSDHRSWRNSMAPLKRLGFNA
ncbi:hypothetical protein MTX80_23205 (plasmid) [Gordonia amicalis]|nr:hypothetical protein [Gordonia amicalis]UOG23827.1 hypothetical protein MTX80_23205 [Gordonia amicalis]